MLSSSSTMDQQCFAPTFLNRLRRDRQNTEQKKTFTYNGKTVKAMPCSSREFPKQEILDNDKILHSWVSPLYLRDELCLKTDQSGRVGFICLVSGEQVCKEEDLKFIESLEWKNSPAKFSIPSGTVAVILATGPFEVPPSASFNLQEHLMDPAYLPAMKDGKWNLRRSTNRLACIEWYNEEFNVLAGLLIEPASIEEVGNLKDGGEKRMAEKLMEMGDEECADYIKCFQESQPPPPAPVVAPAPPTLPAPFIYPTPSEIPHPNLPMMTDFRINPNFLVPPGAQFIKEQVLYYTLCPATLCNQYAYLKEDNQIEIHTFDRFGTPKWGYTTCKDCLLQIQRAVRKLGYRQSFTFADYYELTFAPPHITVTHYNLPPTSPFISSQILCAYNQDSCLEKYFLVLKADGLLGFYAYNSYTSGWSAKIPDTVFEKMEKSVRKRGITNKFCKTDVVGYVRMIGANNGEEVPLPIPQFLVPPPYRPVGNAQSPTPAQIPIPEVQETVNQEELAAAMTLVDLSKSFKPQETPEIHEEEPEEEPEDAPKIFDAKRDAELRAECYRLQREEVQARKDLRAKLNEIDAETQARKIAEIRRVTHENNVRGRAQQEAHAKRVKAFPVTLNDYQTKKLAEAEKELSPKEFADLKAYVYKLRAGEELWKIDHPDEKPFMVSRTEDPPRTQKETIVEVPKVPEVCTKEETKDSEAETVTGIQEKMQNGEAQESVNFDSQLPPKLQALVENQNQRMKQFEQLRKAMRERKPKVLSAAEIDAKWQQRSLERTLNEAEPSENQPSTSNAPPPPSKFAYKPLNTDRMPQIPKLVEVKPKASPKKITIKNWRHNHIEKHQVAQMLDKWIKEDRDQEDYDN